MTRLLASFAPPLALALTLASIGPARAADFSYSWIEGGYTDVGVKHAPDADGWTLGGSIALGDRFFLYGSDTQVEIANSDVFDAQFLRLGLGWHTALGERSDLVLRANHLALETNFPGPDSHGYEAEGGLRTAHTEKLETYVALGWVDAGRSDGDLYGKLGAQYKFNERFGLVANATLSDDANQYFVGPRLSF